MVIWCACHNKNITIVLLCSECRLFRIKTLGDWGASEAGCPVLSTPGSDHQLLSRDYTFGDVFEETAPNLEDGHQFTQVPSIWAVRLRCSTGASDCVSWYTCPPQTQGTKGSRLLIQTYMRPFIFLYTLHVCQWMCPGDTSRSICGRKPTHHKETQLHLHTRVLNPGPTFFTYCIGSCCLLVAWVSYTDDELTMK